MSSEYVPELVSGWHVDQSIICEEERVVVIRFGRPATTVCMALDELIWGVAVRCRKFAVVYSCDIDVVEDFNEMYELYDDACLMFFFRNKHIMVDFGTGNNNKLDFPLENPQDLVDILEAVYRGATRGKGLVVSPIDFSGRKRS